MKERPILFSGPMVRAILDGKKTQARRVVKPQPLHMGGGELIMNGSCPYGKPGDRLWVRETFCETECDGGPCIVWRSDLDSWYIGATGDKRDGTWKYHLLARTEVAPYDDFHWKPSIHMPRWASRILLEVTEVRVERVQEINEADAISEGCPPVYVDPTMASYADGFRVVWDSINAKRGYGWEANPWVWVVSFRLIEPNSLNWNG